MLWRQFPFSTFDGLNADNTNAGYNPASSNVTKKTIPVNGSSRSDQLNDQFRFQ